VSLFVKNLCFKYGWKKEHGRDWRGAKRSRLVREWRRKPEPRKAHKKWQDFPSPNIWLNTKAPQKNKKKHPEKPDAFAF